MIQTIKTITDQFLSFLLDDPVRPSIPYSDRVGENKDIFVLRGEDDKVMAITCVSYQENVPTSEADLFERCSSPHVAITHHSLAKHYWLGMLSIIPTT